MRNPKAVILMGVSGCGKSSAGKRLAKKLGWLFFDGDLLHSMENIAKMASGIPLDDKDRTPWIGALNNLIANCLGDGQSIILACSALKQFYRDQRREGNPGTIFVYLKGDFHIIYNRMEARPGHYMKFEMLKSQFANLEEPTDALTVNIDQSIDEIVGHIIKNLRLGKQKGKPKMSEPRENNKNRKV